MVGKSGSYEWSTPEWLFKKYDDQYHFTLDAAASAENTKCKQFFTKEDDALKQNWSGVVWCNPPYMQIIKWVYKAWLESWLGATVVMLLPAGTDTKWFRFAMEKASEIHFISQRLKFGGAKQTAPTPSLIVVFKPGEHGAKIKIV